MNAARCSGRLGLRHHCTLGVLHEGDHVSGERVWAQSTRELAALQRHQAELTKLLGDVLRRRQRGNDDELDL